MSSKQKPSREQIIRAIAGIMILASILLSITVHHNWIWLTAFVGINLFQSSITRWCLMEDLLKKLGY